MELVDTDQFRRFEEFLVDDIKQEASGMIISVPGMGVSIFSDLFIERHPELDVKRITSMDDELASYNIVDIDFDKNDFAVRELDSIVRHARGQKHVMGIVNTPHVIDTYDFRKSRFASVIYKTHFFEAYDITTAALFAKHTNSEIPEDRLGRLYEMTGGIARMVKYFSVNLDKMDVPYDELMTDESFTLVFDSIARVMENTEDSKLHEMCIKRDGKFVGELASHYFKIRPHERDNSIVINPDLTFMENGEISPQPFIKIEKDIVEHVLQEGLITRDQIADIKWGEDSYDAFSDQAITKTVSRLNKKLQKHQLEAVPKVGYKLVMSNQQ